MEWVLDMERSELSDKADRMELSTLIFAQYYKERCSAKIKRKLINRCKLYISRVCVKWPRIYALLVRLRMVDVYRKMINSNEK